MFVFISVELAKLSIKQKRQTLHYFDEDPDKSSHKKAKEVSKVKKTEIDVSGTFVFKYGGKKLMSKMRLWAQTTENNELQKSLHRLE